MAAVTELASAVGTRADMLTLSELEKLPLRRGWGVKELQSYLAHPTAGTTWHWWWQTPEGTAVSAEVAAAVGRRLLKEETDGPQKAAECWSGFISSRPSLVHEWVERYSTQPVLGGLGSVLAPYQMLVALYYTYPQQLDPSGFKSAELVNHLFDAKAEFIQQGEWQATQILHTTLAAIYVQRLLVYYDVSLS
jgi:hypothetical protein